MKVMTTALGVLLLGWATGGLSHALHIPPPFAQGGLAVSHLVNDAHGQPRYFSLPVDHFNEGNTYQNKYYVNDTYWLAERARRAVELGSGADAGCRGLFYMGGEGPLGGTPQGFVADLAREFGAVLVAIEHRFYGESVPAGGLSTHSLRHLTVAQALADAAALVDHMTVELRAAHPACDDVRWVAVGGSYSGALAAWFRGAYPDRTVGAISSSGVVHAILDFTGFDLQVAEAVGPRCAADIRASTAAFQAELLSGSPQRAAAAKALFGAGVESLQDSDFDYMVADSVAMADQYGHKEALCGALHGAVEPGGAVEPAAALMKATADLTTALWGPQFARGCFYNTSCLRHGPWEADPTQDMSRQWRWQKCTEMAFLQTAPAVGALRSHRLDLSHLLAQCEQIFGPGITPNTTATNLRYGGDHPTYTNVFFADFSDDPWQRASMREGDGSTLEYYLAQCDGCGHCMDLHAPQVDDPPQLQECRRREVAALSRWFNEGFKSASNL